MVWLAGLYRDDWDLTAADWGTERQQHAWAVSHIAPFATNLAVVTWDCGSELDTQAFLSTNIATFSVPFQFSLARCCWRVARQVMLLHNERAVVVPACAAELCSLQQFSAFYRHWAEADFETVCRVEEQPNITLF